MLIGLYKNKSKEEKSEKVQNGNASQHGVEAYEDRYFVSTKMKFPTINIDDEDKFVRQRLVSFNLAVNKLTKNKYEIFFFTMGT